MWWEWLIVGGAVAWAGATLGRRVWRLAADFLATGPARADAASACGHCGACSQKSSEPTWPASDQKGIPCASSGANLPLVTLSLPAVSLPAVRTPALLTPPPE
jgi:hypothetical protein